MNNKKIKTNTNFGYQPNHGNRGYQPLKTINEGYQAIDKFKSVQPPNVGSSVQSSTKSNT